MTVTIDLVTPEVDCLMVLPPLTTCGKLHQNWFIHSQNILLTSVVTRTDGRTREQLKNIMPLLATVVWRKLKNIKFLENARKYMEKINQCRSAVNSGCNVGCICS